MPAVFHTLRSITDSAEDDKRGLWTGRTGWQLNHAAGILSTRFIAVDLDFENRSKQRIYSVN